MVASATALKLNKLIRIASHKSRIAPPQVKRHQKKSRAFLAVALAANCRLPVAH
jgi:hypothetical protein